VLTELYQHALKENLAVRPGFKRKRVKAYLCLSSEGKFLGIELREKGAPDVYAPDVGAAALGTRYCNPLVEKAQIPLRIIKDEAKDKNIPTKSDFYLSMLDDGAVDEPCFAIIAQALRDGETVAAMERAMEEQKLKGADPVSFMVDGLPIEQSEKYFSWWENFRAQFSPTQTGDHPRCLITGQAAPAMATVPKVSGLLAVGGHTSGDAFLCFDKDAFQSYGLKKSANAPVSEEAMTAVNAALADLLRKAEILGGAKLVHWYSGPITEDEDLIPVLFNPGWDNGSYESEETAGNDEKSALRTAQKLIESIWIGKPPEQLSARYYILPLSGAGGRMMVRGWYEGSYEELYQNIRLWFDDLSLVRWNGKGLAPLPKLKALCTRMLKPGGDPKKIWDRMDKELPNLLGRVLNAVIKAGPLPDEAAVRVLHYIRSAILAGEQDEGSRPGQFEHETLAFQLLKAWLIRKRRERGDDKPMGVEKTDRAESAAYCCGQLMATYVAIQQTAMPEVGVGLAQRYYTAASNGPALVIGRLAKLAQHHLSKLDKGLSIYYERCLSEIYVRIGDSKIPTMLSIEQQAEFALGYYQQRAALYSTSASKE